MPRRPRWMQRARAAAYHVLSRGHNREAIFADPDDRGSFLQLLARYRDRFGCLYHDCLMSNHLHLLLQLDEPRRLRATVTGGMASSATDSRVG